MLYILARLASNIWVYSTHRLLVFFCYFLFSAYRSKRLERIMNVGAHSPTKIPNLSPCACASTDFPPVKYQIAIDPMIDAKPSTKHKRLSCFNCGEFIRQVLHNVVQQNSPEILQYSLEYSQPHK